MHIFARRDRQGQDRDPFFGQFACLALRGNATDAACRRFLVMNLSCLFGKTIAYILAAIDQCLDERPEVFPRRALFTWIGLNRLIPCWAAAFDMWPRRQANDSRVVADGTHDLPIFGLMLKIVAGTEPPFEAMAVAAGQVEDDHDAAS